MNVEKKVISNLNKCYAMSEITVEGKRCFVVAAEKHDPCYLFNEDGEFMEKVWDEPGGVMTMAPVPGADGQFLATHKFYSPNDSADAKIVIVTRKGKGDWEVRTLCEAPFVHRFGIFHRAGVNYLLVCCLKSGHSYKNDWRYAGACFAAELPADLSAFNDGNLLELSLVQDGMLRNHGFSKTVWGGHEAAVIGCEQGTFLMEPPRVRGAQWTVTNLLPVPSSDAVLMDFDGDGKLELGLISPFHGNAFSIWHLDEFDNYVPQWKYGAPEKDTEMVHATWADIILGVPTWIVGWRKGTKGSVAITWDAEAGNYRADMFDSNTGMANALHFVRSDGKLELGLISPFHGNAFSIWHLDEFDNYVPQWKYGAPEKDTEMVHATWADIILGVPTWIVGWRKGTKCSVAITWDAEAGDYRADMFDSNTGMANALHFVRSDGKDIVVGTNREIDEVAYYTFTE